MSASTPGPAILGGALGGAEQCSATAPPRPVAGKPVLAVACGVLAAAPGRVLLAQRPAGKVAAGSWEFPGGKIEPGETSRHALDRELGEELGVTVREARPLIRFRHEYSNRTVLLDTWLISGFEGEPHGREDQALAWVDVATLAQHPHILPTVRPIAAALQLPVDYVFTPPEADERWILERLPGLPRGALVRLRLPSWSESRYRDLAVQLLPACQSLGLQLVLDRGPSMVEQIGADGWHATSAILRGLRQRPAPAHCYASCHSREELDLATQLGFTAAVLGPVRATPTHPDAASLGWGRFADWTADTALPVYGLGGLGPAQREDAFQAYAQGVAGISAYW